MPKPVAVAAPASATYAANEAANRARDLLTKPNRTADETAQLIEDLTSLVPPGLLGG